ncbi:MAG: hypothetical protein KDE56_01860 [Anaerolineales bacterium]|nr:hypothetical protein [Anaerolineales bacterium]
MTTSNPLTPFKQLLAEHFNLEELQDLAFALGVKWEEIEGSTLSAKSRGMVVALARNGRLADLVAAARTRRPCCEWPEPPSPSEQMMLAAAEPSGAKVDARGAKIGVMGDQAHIEGGLHFGDTFNMSGDFRGATVNIKPPKLPFILDTLPFRLRANIESFLATYLGTAEKPIPFGGRDEALRQLETWRTGSDKSFLLLAAPAGRGKSSLLVRWYQWLLQADEVAVIFVPISVRFSTNLAEAVFPCLAVQLAELQGREIPSDYIKMTPERWQFLVAEYLREPLPDGRQLLIILDGLDEAAWEIGPNLFPLQLPERVRVVVSARYLAGEATSAEPWLRRLGWERLGQAETLALETLTQAGVQDVLLKMGCPLDELGAKVDIVAELHRLSEGDPLLVELYVLDLWQRGEAAARLQPEDLAAIEPGYGGFFARWWADQERLWQGEDPLEKEAVETLLYCLAMALGPLTISDLKALLSASVARNKRVLQKAAEPLRRFIVGDGEQQGYVLAHPKLGDYFREEFLDVTERAEWEQQFIGWGQATLTTLQTAKRPDYDGVSRYLLQYYGRHLETSQAEIALYLQLVSWVWLQSWQRYTGTAVGFLRDVDIVLGRLCEVNETAVKQNQFAPYLDEEVRCMLCHASINNIAANIPNNLILDMYRYGDWTAEQALAQAQLKTDPEAKAKACQNLASYLPLAFKRIAYQEALAAVRKVEDRRTRVEMLIALIPHLPDAQRSLVLRDILEQSERTDDEFRGKILVALTPLLPTEVLAVVEQIKEEKYRAEVLIVLAPLLPADVLVVVERVEEEGYRAKVLTVLAPLLPTQVLAIAKKIRVEVNRAEVLLALASQMPTEVLNIAERLWNKQEQARVLMAIALQLRDEERSRVLNATLGAVAQIEHEWRRAEVLISLISWMPDEVLVVAKQLKEEQYRAKVLVSLACQMPIEKQGMVLTSALATVEQVKEDKYRAEMLAVLAPLLPDKVLTAVEQVKEDRYRTEVLKVLALTLPTEVLAAIEQVNEDKYRAEVLVALVPLLPDKVLIAVEQIKEDRYRAEVLKVLALTLPTEVLAEVEQVKGDKYRAEVLEVLAPFLPDKVLIAVEQVKEDRYRAGILAALAPLLPVEVLPAVKQVKNQRTRGWILQAVLPYLLIEERSEVLVAELTSAQKIQDEYHQILILIEIASHLPSKAKTKIQASALELARRIEGNRRRAEALIGFASSMPLEQRAEIFPETLVVELAEMSSDFEGFSNFWTLKKLAQYIPERALLAAQEITNEKRQADFLVAIAFHFPREVLIAANKFQDERCKAKILKSLVSYLPSEVLTLAKSFRDEGIRAWVIKDLAPCLPIEVFALTKEILNKDIQAWLLRALAPYLPIEVLGLVRKIEDEERRAWVMEALVATLPFELPEEAQFELLEEVQWIENEWSRVRLLKELALHLPGQAIMAIYDSRIRWLGNWAEIFVKLIPYLSDEKRIEWVESVFFGVTQDIADEEDRAAALHELIPYLPEKVLLEAQDIWNAEIRAKLLCALASRLPMEVLAATREFDEEEGWQIDVLQTLSPLIPIEVLKETEKIWDKDFQIRVLRTLIPYVPDKILLTLGKIADNDQKTEVFKLMADYIAKLEVPVMYAHWQTGLKLCRQARREIGLGYLARMIPVIKILGGEGVLQKIVSIIQTTCQWWP